MRVLLHYPSLTVVLMLFAPKCFPSIIRYNQLQLKSELIYIKL